VLQEPQANRLHDLKGADADQRHAEQPDHEAARRQVEQPRGRFPRRFAVAAATTGTGRQLEGREGEEEMRDAAQAARDADELALGIGPGTFEVESRLEQLPGAIG